MKKMKIKDRYLIRENESILDIRDTLAESYEEGVDILESAFEKTLEVRYENDVVYDGENPLFTTYTLEDLKIEECDVNIELPSIDIKRGMLYEYISQADEKELDDIIQPIEYLDGGKGTYTAYLPEINRTISLDSMPVSIQPYQNQLIAKALEDDTLFLNKVEIPVGFIVYYDGLTNKLILIPEGALEIG